MNLQELLSTLESPIVIRPTRRMTLGELETYLDKAADILRGNADHSEFRGYVFALLFYKRINDCFEEEVRAQTTKLRRAGIADEQANYLARRPEIHHFVVPEPAAWGRVARSAKGQLGQALNDAMLAIERANAHRQNNFDGILTGKIDFNKQDELPRDKLVNLINHFGSQTFDRAHVSDDLFGNAYEYLIRNFASKAGKSSGEFYTPAEVGFLMAEVLQPKAAMSICDWASGSGGLLLQCIRHVKKHGGDVRQLRLHGQESNVATYNISRINMILHGIPVWDHKQGDSLRDPRHLTADNRLRQFDRIIMNPPFSLEDWGYDTVAAGDKFGRLSYGMPPASNGDWAWLQQIVKSLKDADPVTGVGGQGMVVMSQGVLFRGQPEQTEEEDGQNQKADAEYVIRRGFIEADLIEAIVVLPGKLFYGNGVPGCLVLLNKAKPAARKDKVLMIWASRHFQKGNPQNLLRPSDLMRILVPWRAFGDLATAQRLVPEHEAALIREVEDQRDARLADIEDAYGPVLEPLPRLRAELITLEALDLKQQAVKDAITPEHPYFHPLAPLRAEVERIETQIATAGRGEKAALKTQLVTPKAKFDVARKKLIDAIKTRHKQVARAVKELTKLQEERDAREQELKLAAEREIAHLREAADDLLRICGSEGEARRYFTVVGRAEIEENEFNLNLPRYVEHLRAGRSNAATRGCKEPVGCRECMRFGAPFALRHVERNWSWKMKLAACQRFDPLNAPMDWVVEPIKRRLCLEYGSSLTEDVRRAGSVPVFGSNGCVGTHDTARVEGPGILVGRKGSVGEIHFSESEFWPIDTVYYVRRLGQDDWGFLYYLLGFLNLDLLNAATGVPGLTRRDAHDILGAFPDLEEQRRVAAALKLADEAIQEARAELDSARELFRALLKSLFEFGVAASDGLYHSKWLTCPAHWSIRPLKEISSVHSGFTMGRDLSRAETVEVRYVTVVNVQDGRFDLRGIGSVEIKREELATATLRYGDILMTEGGDRDKLGRGAMWRNEVDQCVFQNHIFRVRLGPDYKSELFHFLIQTYQAKRYFYAHAKQTSNLCTINSRELKNWPVAIPPIPEQERMIEVLQAAEHQCSAVEAKIESLQGLKRSLLQNLLTGKVRIPPSIPIDA